MTTSMDRRRAAALALVGLALTPATANAALNETSVVTAPGTPGAVGDNSGFADGAALSADGRYVLFTSGADNLTANDNDAFANAYVRDRWTGTTELVSLPSGSDGTSNTSISTAQAISADRALRRVRIGSRQHRGRTTTTPPRTSTCATAWLGPPSSSACPPAPTARATTRTRRRRPSQPTAGTWPSRRTRRTWPPTHTPGLLNTYVRDRLTDRTTLVSLPTGHDGDRGSGRFRRPADLSGRAIRRVLLRRRRPHPRRRRHRRGHVPSETSSRGPPTG